MTMRQFPVTRWLVVDDTAQDAEDIALAIEGLGGRVDIADSIKSAEKLLKKNIYDVCIVDCFYKGSSKWGIDLLPELRSSMPGLPVVMISNSDDIELPGKVIRAGADIFCPKLKDSFSLTKALGASALQALAIRRLRVMETGSEFAPEIYLTKQTLDSIEHSLRRKEERLLICGEAGTGKTQTAQLFAKNFLKQNYGSLSRNIVFHDCAAKSDEINSNLLFGERTQNSNSLQLNLFERAIGGVLILDNIHALSLELQNRLKSIFDTGFIVSSANSTEGYIPLSLMKCVATYMVGSHDKIVPGFLEAYAHREVDLPSLTQMECELENILVFLLGQLEQRNTELKVTASVDVLPKLLDMVSTYSFPANFRTLNQILENALSRALAERRSQIYASDLEIIGSLRAQVLLNTKEHRREQLEIFDGRLGEAFIRNIAGGENFDEAKDLLRKIMISVASKKHNGNKSKIAASLGISRQSLYDHEETLL